MKCLLGMAFSVVCYTLTATTWYVDSENGNDAFEGKTPAQAVKTLKRVNKIAVKPGDKVLFKRGGLWRGTLRAKSGDENNVVTYGTYGVGPKPILQQSIDRSRPEDWVDVGNGIWATLPTKPPCKLEQIAYAKNLAENWGSSFQEGNQGSCNIVSENGERFVRVKFDKKVRAASNLLQLWGSQICNLPDSAVMTMRVRSSIPFKLGRLSLSMNHLPWTTALSGIAGEEVSSTWREIEVPLKREAELNDAFLHFSIGDVLPEGAVFDFQVLGLWRVDFDNDNPIPTDVGIFICNHGEKWGVKKWRNPDWHVPPTTKSVLVSQPLDFWYAPKEYRVFVKYPENPGKAFNSIELALTRHIVDEGGCHDVVYDGLCVRYGAAHGFGGGDTRNIVIRNCDIYWIGGGLQFWRVDEKTGKILYPVRYGNAIEFWGTCANNLVERNRIWQVYDAALTNQSSGDPRPEVNVTWRDNVIWQSEYSFEYWNHDLRSYTSNILFEHNTCVDAGYGWAHEQRPNPNGAHLMFYDNAAPTTNFVVRNNLFVRTRDRSTRFFNDWRVKNPEVNDGLTMDNNLYWIPSGKICEYHVNGREKRVMPTKIRLESGVWGSGEEAFKAYQKEFKLDQASVYGEVEFVDEADHNYQLKPNSFGSKLATDGGPLGARNMPGLSQDQSRSL